LNCELERKHFFFEKKKQKTFVHCCKLGFNQGARTLPEISKSFLLLFFKKEVLAFSWRLIG
jgi:hypothetical protein